MQRQEAYWSEIRSLVMFLSGVKAMFDAIENPSAVPGPCTSEARLGASRKTQPRPRLLSLQLGFTNNNINNQLQSSAMHSMRLCYAPRKHFANG
jgi:hypothetical protein